MRPRAAEPEILLQPVAHDEPEVMALYEPFILEADGPLADDLYRAAGYREVADYDGNAKADLWFERELQRSASGDLTRARRRSL